MKNDLSCEVVRDLLPSYADELLSDVSREAVDVHLDSCDACKEAAAQMKRTYETPTQEEEDLFFLGAFRKLNLQYRFVIIFAVCIIMLLPTVAVVSSLYDSVANRTYPVTPESVACTVTEDNLWIKMVLPDGYYGDYSSWSYHYDSGRLTYSLEAKKEAEASGYVHEVYTSWSEWEMTGWGDCGDSFTQLITELWVEGMDEPIWINPNTETLG